MKIFVFCALIFCLGLDSAFALADGKKAEVIANYTSALHKSIVFNLKKPLLMTCNVTLADGVNASNVSIDWKKEGHSYVEDKTLNSRFKTSTNGLSYSLKTNDGKAEDVGNWSCHIMVSGIEEDSANIEVVTNIAVKIKTASINVVEEEKLRIECSVLGIPLPTITWRIETDNYNGTEFDDRVQIENYQDDDQNTVENGVLFIEKVNKTDRGQYYCIGTNQYWELNRDESHSMIRVKDKYAALWPFLGICIEVIVLCAVIIIYEKKRNKTEMEESDTDQSPDQKNTTDHGKEANLRHRQ